MTKKIEQLDSRFIVGVERLEQEAIRHNHELTDIVVEAELLNLRTLREEISKHHARLNGTIDLSFLEDRSWTFCGVSPELYGK